MSAANLMLRIDPAAKKLVTRAASLRGVSTSDWVRSVITAEARREIKEATTQTIALSEEDQRRFWDALQKPARLTKKQKELAKLMRGG